MNRPAVRRTLLFREPWRANRGIPVRTGMGMEYGEGGNARVSTDEGKGGAWSNKEEESSVARATDADDVYPRRQAGANLSIAPSPLLLCTFPLHSAWILFSWFSGRTYAAILQYCTIKLNSPAGDWSLLRCCFMGVSPLARLEHSLPAPLFRPSEWTFRPLDRCVISVHGTCRPTTLKGFAAWLWRSRSIAG
jgi:hypothetical protein